MARTSFARKVLWVLLTAILTGLVGLGFAFVQKWTGLDRDGQPGPSSPNSPPTAQTHVPPPTPDTRPLPARPVKAPLDVLSAILADLQGIEPAARPRQRYLTLTHLHNNRDLSEQDLEAVRKTLGPLASQLSPPGQVATLRPV